MKHPRLAEILSILAALFLGLCLIPSLRAGSATWLPNPGSGDWNTAGNWTPVTVPNGASDTATFALSNTTAVSLSAITQVDGIVFNAGGSAFTITASPGNQLAFVGAGITNNSGVVQNFVADVLGGSDGIFLFQNSANAGTQTAFTIKGSATAGISGAEMDFRNTSSAGSSTVTNTGGSANGASGGFTEFFDSSTAGAGTFNNKGGVAAMAFGGTVSFGNSSNAGSATITNEAGTILHSFGGLTVFSSDASASTAAITNKGSSFSNDEVGTLRFNGNSTAAGASIHNEGGAASGGGGGVTEFFDTSSAGSATITVDGGAADGAGAGLLTFHNSATAASASITTNGATADNAFGAVTDFRDNSHAGNAHLTVNGSTNNNAGSGFLTFHDNSSAENAVITLNPPSGVGTAPGSVTFLDSSTAANSILTANGASNGGGGGSIEFIGDSLGGSAAITLNGNATLEIGNHTGGVEIGSLAGDGSVILGNNNLTVGNLNTDTTFSGILQNGGGTAGSLTKVGTGTLILSGINTYTGNTEVDGGTLQVDGSIASPTTIVAASGTLSGTGTIGGTLDNFGHVAPGDSPGTLTVLGNYNQASSARLEIEVGGLAAGVDSDLLHMNGTASLDGALDVIRINNFAPLPGDRVTILRADAGRGGTMFATVSAIGWNGLIQPTADYTDPLTVDIVFQLSSTFESQGLTRNQMSVGEDIDDVVGDSRANALIAFLGHEPMANLPHDFDLIAPEELASIYEIGFSQAVVTNMNLQHRMDDIRAGSTGFCGNGYQAHETSGYSKDSDGKVALDKNPTPAFVPSPENRWGIFATGSGDFVNVGDHDTNAHGYDITTGGVTVGVDYRVCDHFAVGIDGSYNGSQADLVDRGRVDVDGGKAGAYATFFGYKILGSMIHIDGAVSGGWNSYDTNRTGLEDLPVRGSTNGNEFNAMLSYGGDWHFGCLLIGTWSSLQYTNVQIDSFTETGSLAPLEIQDQNEDSFRSTSGLRVAYDIKAGNAIIRPEVRGAWQHEYGDRSYPIDARLASGAGDIFTVWGPHVGRDSALVDAGFAVQWNARFSTYVYYDGVLGRSNYTNNAVSGGLRISF